MTPACPPDRIPAGAQTAALDRPIHFGDTECGNISYVVEEWANQAAFDGHLRSSHFARYLASSEPLLREPPRILVAAPLPL